MSVRNSTESFRNRFQHTGGKKPTEAVGFEPCREQVNCLGHKLDTIGVTLVKVGRTIYPRTGDGLTGGKTSLLGRKGKSALLEKKRLERIKQSSGRTEYESYHADALGSSEGHDRAQEMERVLEGSSGLEVTAMEHWLNKSQQYRNIG